MNQNISCESRLLKHVSWAEGKHLLVLLLHEHLGKMWCRSLYVRGKFYAGSHAFMFKWLSKLSDKWKNTFVIEGGFFIWGGGGLHSTSSTKYKNALSWADNVFLQLIHFPGVSSIFVLLQIFREGSKGALLSLPRLSNGSIFVGASRWCCAVIVTFPIIKMFPKPALFWCFQERQSLKH